MSSPIEIDVLACWQRLEKVYQNWEANKDEEGPTAWNSADSLVLSVGEASSSDDQDYKKSGAIQTWLFGYEFPETVLVFCKEVFYILTSARKRKILEVLTKEEDGKKSPVLIELLTKGDENKEYFDKLIEAMKKSFDGKVYGSLLHPKKDNPTGTFITSWLDALKESGLESVVAQGSFGQLLAVKDAKEQKNVKTSAAITSHILKAVLLPNIEVIKFTLLGPGQNYPSTSCPSWTAEAMNVQNSSSIFKDMEQSSSTNKAIELNYLTQSSHLSQSVEQSIQNVIKFIQFLTIETIMKFGVWI